MASSAPARTSLRSPARSTPAVPRSMHHTKDGQPPYLTNLSDNLSGRDLGSGSLGRLGLLLGGVRLGVLPAPVPDTVQLRQARRADEEVDRGERVVDWRDDQRVADLWVGWLVASRHVGVRRSWSRGMPLAPRVTGDRPKMCGRCSGVVYEHGRQPRQATPSGSSPIGHSIVSARGLRVDSLRSSHGHRSLSHSPLPEPTHPDEARSGERDVLADRELVGRALEVLDAGSDEGPLGEGSPEEDGPVGWGGRGVGAGSAESGRSEIISS